jgi:hypothetical protein
MLPIKLIMQIIIFSSFMFLLIVFLVQKNLFTIKYSLIWIFSIVGFLMSALIPNFLTTIQIWLGFEVLSNMIFAVLIGILIFLSMNLTVIVSRQKENIRLLTQEIALIKERINRNND